MRTLERQADYDQTIRSAITQLLGLKYADGATPQELRTLAKDCLNSVSNYIRLNQSGADLDLHKVGSVLRNWHRDTCYLTSEGFPRPLSVSGRDGLRKLVEKYYPSSKFDAVLKVMRRARLIRKFGARQWVPTTKHALFSMQTQTITAHLAEGIYRLAQTVNRNMNSRNQADILFERASKVRHLPIAEASAFRDYVRRQATAFLTTIDDWLEARVSESGSATKKTCTAGLYTFAFMDDLPPPVVRRTRQSRKR